MGPASRQTVPPAFPFDGDGTRALRALADRHWALRAIPEERRRLTFEAADRAWELFAASPASGDAAGRAERAPPPMARALTRSERADVEELLRAYEVVALEQIALVLQLDARATPAGAHRELLGALAQGCLRLRRALPPAVDARTAQGEALELVAMSSLAEDPVTRRLWLARRPPDRHDAIDDAVARDGWEDAVRQGIHDVWIRLLDREAAPEALEEAFEALGRWREARVMHEAAYLAGLTATQAQYVNLRLLHTYALATAAADLVLALRHQHRRGLGAALAHAFREAQGTVLAGTPEDRVLPWLHAAARGVALRVATQLALPGLLE